MKIEFSRQFDSDMKRLCDFLAARNQSAVAEFIDGVLDAATAACEMPYRHPAFQPELNTEIRQMPVDIGRLGYLALYRVVTDKAGKPASLQFLAIRSTKEAGY